jgi:hypothetical protein
MAENGLVGLETIGICHATGYDTFVQVLFQHLAAEGVPV